MANCERCKKGIVDATGLIFGSVPMVLNPSEVAARVAGIVLGIKDKCGKCKEEDVLLGAILCLLHFPETTIYLN